MIRRARVTASVLVIVAIAIAMWVVVREGAPPSDALEQAAQRVGVPAATRGDVHQVRRGDRLFVRLGGRIAAELRSGTLVLECETQGSGIGERRRSERRWTRRTFRTDLLAVPRGADWCLLASDGGRHGPGDVAGEFGLTTAGRRTVQRRAAAVDLYTALYADTIARQGDERAASTPELSGIETKIAEPLDRPGEQVAAGRSGAWTDGRRFFFTKTTQTGDVAFVDHDIRTGSTTSNVLPLMVEAWSDLAGYRGG